MSWPVTEFDALCANDPELAELRTAIREFLAADREEFGWEPAVDSWLARWDAGLLRATGRRGVRRSDHPHRVRRTRAGASAPLRGDRGTAGTRCACRRALVLRSPVRAVAVVVRNRRAAPGIAAGHRRRPDARGDRDERARRGVRPGRGQDASEARRRRLDTQRHQGVDERCPPGASDSRAGPHQPARSGPPACRLQPVHRRAGLTGHHHRSRSCRWAANTTSTR